MVNFSSKYGNFRFGIISSFSGNSNSSVVFSDFFFAFLFLLVVERVSFGLLGGQILSNFG